MTKEKTAPNEPEVKAQGLKELDHPCKNTCSGWQQGFEAGQAALSSRADCGEFEAIEKEIDKHAGCWAIANKRESWQSAEDFKMGALWFKANAEKFLAGQKSQAAKLRLPENKTGSNSVSQDMETFAEYHYNKGYNAAIDAVKSMNEGK